MDQYIYAFLPKPLSSIYLLYVSLFTAVLFLVLTLRFTLKNSPKKASLDYLRDTNRELNELADKSATILNAIGDGVVLIDNEGTIKLLNPSAGQILGWSTEDAVGLNYSSVIKLVDEQDSDVTIENNVVSQVIGQHTEVRPPTLTMKTRNDKKILVSLVASPIGSAGQGVIVIFRDVTKEKAEEREQAEFISTASHEMRTPVASIEGYLGLALNPATSTIDARATDYIQKAQNSASHLGRLFQDLLDVSKADDHRLSNSPEVTDVTDLVKSALDDLQIKAAEKTLSLTFKPAAASTTNMTKIQPIYYANIDRGHLHDLITNLTENAIKYTVQGGVTVDVEGDSDHILISITDTGIGIPNEDIPHLFQKFYRVNNKETNEIGGTGLGLYLVRKLAEALEGRVWVESEYGKGATFFVELPRLNNPANVPTATPLQSSPTTAQTPPAPTLSSAVVTPNKNNEQPSPMSNYSVPRGDTLTAEQKAEYVKKLQRMGQNNN